MKLQYEYDGLLDQVVERRKDVVRFLHFLETETNWLTCPASTHHHLNRMGGLILHSVLTTRTLLQIRPTLAPEYAAETCVVTGLFHDVGKIGAPGRPYYIATGKSGRKDVPFKINEELVHMGLGVRSLYLCARFLPLSDEEAQAICYHDGQYVPDNLTVKNKEAPLTLLLHFADMWSSHVTEHLPLPADVKMLPRTEP